MRLSHPPAPSYYALGDSWTPRTDLQGEVRADVTVLGGGIAGCAAALHLTKRGYKVALLEARDIGSGAAGRSGGQSIFGWGASQQKLEREVGREDARRLFDLSIEALDLTQSLIREHAIDCDYRPNHLHLAAKPRHVRELEQWTRELRDDYGYASARLVYRAELQDHVRSDRYLSALLEPSSAHLQPLKYTRGPARPAETAGAVLYGNSCI